MWNCSRSSLGNKVSVKLDSARRRRVSDVRAEKTHGGAWSACPQGRHRRQLVDFKTGDAEVPWQKRSESSLSLDRIMAPMLTTLLGPVWKDSIKDSAAPELEQKKVTMATVKHGRWIGGYVVAC